MGGFISLRKTKIIILVSILVLVTILAYLYTAEFETLWCGGIAGKECPVGFICGGRIDFPDDTGDCVFRPITWFRWNVLRRF